ncbi:hypothetical protein HanXRQr2_Chr13g0583331 [Helianthus annuus]|uniref:Uncharacterized protein n=1 Tax=Helianthus annuus TaxID=4232 RepID=A0A9K3H9R8_HELAN|nr:hypothetical protein HanXRQr2_Chr13g0583331 [Helianthus annuus]KAJ0848781.1 hypothetical protein HanPSC8_Chr13g0561481 [Helianthus annuus]
MIYERSLAAAKTRTTVAVVNQHLQSHPEEWLQRSGIKVPSTPHHKGRMKVLQENRKWTTFLLIKKLAAA